MVRFLLIIALLVMSAPQARGQVAPGAIDGKMLEKSIKAVLGSHGEVRWESFAFPGSRADAIKEQLRLKSVPDTVHVGITETPDGIRWIIPDIAPSKSETYSFVLYLTPEREIIDVDVLEYRESYGYEIDYSFFREQFHGKKSAEEVRFRRSIQNISGATISARSLTWAVHDLLLILNTMEVK